MNILLINPNTKTKYPQPPLGLLSVGTVCQQLGHTVKLLDMNAGAKLNGMIMDADIVGITATSLSYREAKKLATHIRENFPPTYIVFGGVQASIAPQEVLESGLFSVVVAGEGDNISIIKGVIDDRYRKWNAGGIPIIEATGYKTNLDDLPILDYSLLDGYWYKAMPSHGLHGAMMPMLTSRGCPYHCSFCSKAVFGSKYRSQTPERIIEEVKHLKNSGVKEIAFYDDIFTINHKNTYRLMELLTPLGMHWTCQSRVNLVDAPLLKAMRSAGCFAIAYGLESGVPEILKAINKDTTVEQAEEAVRLTQQAGIRVIAYFMLGSPGETGETIDATVRWAIKLNPDYAQFSITTALPGSELWEQRQFNSYAMGGLGNGLCDLSAKELNSAISQAYSGFYLRPRYVLRQGKRALSSWGEFKSTLKGLEMFIRGADLIPKRRGKWN